jgi:hypothetical protein
MRLSYPTWRTRIVCALLWLFAFSTFVKCEEGLSFNEVPPIIIDQSSSASVVLQFRSGSAPAKVALSVGDFQSVVTGEPQNAHVTFAGLSDIAGKSVYQLSTDLQPNTTLFLRLDITNLKEAGESTAILYNDGKQIGTLKALKNQFPFAIRLNESTAQDRAEISFWQSEQRILLLKNDDPMTYPIHWEVVIRGTRVVGDDVIPGGGVAPIQITTPPREWFLTGLTGLLKPDVQDANILLRYRPAVNSVVQYPQQKALPIEAHLHYYPTRTQEIAGTITVFVALFAGGILSLVASNWIPNQLRRRDLRDKLASLANKISDISFDCDSSLRVLVRVERRRLAELLESRFAITPDMAGIFTQCEAGITALEKRVGLLKNIDENYARLIHLSVSSLPPSLAKQILDNLRKASRLLRSREMQDGDLQTIRSLISDASAALDDANQPNDQFARLIAARVNELKTDFSNDGLVGRTDACKNISDRLPGPLEALDDKYTDPLNIKLNDYSRLDRSLLVLDQIKDYILIHESSTDSDFRKTIEESLKLLLQYWRQPSPPSLHAGRLLLVQLNEGDASADLIAAITATPPRISIETEPKEVRTYQHVRWTAKFDRDDFNNSAASEEISCIWDFDDGLNEKGWTVTHYYSPSRKPRRVKLTFKDSMGKLITNEKGEPIKVMRTVKVLRDSSINRWDRSKSEIIRLFIVLLVALLGLMAGAQQQLSKLDIIPGLIAVFLLGFSADAIKNIVTPISSPNQT